MLFEQQISILEIFLKDHVTLRTEVMADKKKISFRHMNNLH